MNNLLIEASALLNDAISFRRDLHQYPELGFQELRTSRLVADELEQLGLEVRKGIAGTGVIALLKGRELGASLLVRADMDALPIQEETGTEYTSKIDGVMHACGHDGHVAIALAVARLLSKNRDLFKGTVKFVFQPAEELLIGAQRMIDEGVLQDPVPEAAICLHLDNSKPIGRITATKGLIMASAASFSVEIQGQGGHGALPHQTRDPILAAACVVSAIQSIIARNVDPLETAVVSVGSIHGGEAFNVIPPKVKISGTIRTYNPKVRKLIIKRLGEIVRGVSKGMGCKGKLEIKELCPALINDIHMTDMVQAVAGKIFPETKIDVETKDSTSDDMACFMEHIPGCYFYVGSCNHELGLDASHHDPGFNFDEQAMLYGIAIMAGSILEFLR